MARIQDLSGRRLPIDQAGLFGPEGLGVVHRTTIELTVRTHAALPPFMSGQTSIQPSAGLSPPRGIDQRRFIESSPEIP
jgi:hypothetical protein